MSLGDVAAFDARPDLLPGFRADHMDISPLPRIKWMCWTHAAANTTPHRHVASLGDMSRCRWKSAAPTPPPTPSAFSTRRTSPRFYRFEAGVQPFTSRAARTASTRSFFIAYDPETEDHPKRARRGGLGFEAPHHGLAATPDDRLLCLAGQASDYAGIVRTDRWNLHRPPWRRAALRRRRRLSPTWAEAREAYLRRRHPDPMTADLFWSFRSPYSFLATRRSPR